VPRLLDFQNKRVFTNFVKKLECAGYAVWYDVVFAPDYGVPQRRSRLVLLASLRGEVPLIPATHERSGYETVEQAIGSLPPLAAGGVCEDDPLHRSSRLSDTNIERIRASRPGGSWADWRPELRADCHKAATGKGYRGVYGRMRADEPAPTITTQFFGFGNGRFGHPTQERALSLREGAILQSFPPDYSFAPPGESIQFKKLGRLIGNAVPVALGRAIARSISIHMMEDRP
jgi:DNA (cytosine-5)-methyltransferase 1